MNVAWVPVNVTILPATAAAAWVAGSGKRRNVAALFVIRATRHIHPVIVLFAASAGTPQDLVEVRSSRINAEHGPFSGSH
jgi:hypothetical protein